MVFDADGELVARAPQFVEDLLIVDLDVDAVYRKRLLDPRGRATPSRRCPRSRSASEPGRRPAGARRGGPAPLLDPSARCTRRSCSARGTTREERLHRRRDRPVRRHRLVARRRASPPTRSGAEHVHGVSMPSRYSSDGSRTDAEALAAALGIDYRTIAIEPAFAAFLEMLAPSFAGRDARPHRGEPAEPHPRACCSWRCRTSSAGWC